MNYAFKSSKTFFVKIAAAAANYFLLISISNVTEVTEYAVFSILFSIMMIAGIGGSFGAQIFFVKEVPFQRVNNSKSKELGVYKYTKKMVAISATLMAILFFFTSKFFVKEVEHLAIISCITLVYLISFTQATIGALRVQDSLLYALFSRDFLWRFLSIVLILVAYFITGLSLNSGMIFLILALSLFPIFIHHIFCISKYLKSKFSLTKEKKDFGSWTKTSLGLTLVALISGSDLYIFTIFSGELLTSTDVGVFFTSLKTVELINLFLMSVTLVFAPKISELVAKGDVKLLQSTCNRAIVIQSIPAILSSIVLILLAPFILTLFDPAFKHYSLVLQLLTFGMLINALTGATVLLMQLGNMYWIQVALQGGSLLVALVIMPFLVQNHGIYGAVISFLIAKFAWNFCAIYAITKKLKVDPSVLGLLRKV